MKILLNLPIIVLLFPDKKDIILVKFLMRTVVCTYKSSKVAHFVKERWKKSILIFNEREAKEWREKEIIKIKKVLEKDELEKIKGQSIIEIITWLFFYPPSTYIKICEKLKIIKNIVTEFYIKKCRKWNMIKKRENIIN